MSHQSCYRFISGKNGRRPSRAALLAPPRLIQIDATKQAGARGLYVDGGFDHIDDLVNLRVDDRERPRSGCAWPNSPPGVIGTSARLWLQADIKAVSRDVCFRGQSGHALRNAECLLLTRSGPEPITQTKAAPPECRRLLDQPQ